MMQGQAASFEEELQKAAQYMAQRLMPAPGVVPTIPGIDIHGMTIPFNGIAGGDLIVYVNFDERFDLDSRIARALGDGHTTKAERLQRLKRKGGILVADVAGHEFTDAARALMLNQAFHVGALYEMDHYGEITTRLFELINTRFCKSATARNLADDPDASSFITMIYGEIADTGRFRFVNAGHPLPLVFSKEFGRFVDISEDRLVSFPPIGLQPSEEQEDRRRYQRVLGYKKRYTLNDLNLMGEGDVLLLYTDGLLDTDTEYTKARLEHAISNARDGSARDICQAIIDDRRRDARIADDLSVVAIKYH
jgi:serine phosphatase RsbU (regulator of sigma subunit)